MNSITFSKLSTTTPAGTRVRRLFDGLEGTLERIDVGTSNATTYAYVDLGRSDDDTWGGTLAAWELVEPRPMAQAPAATYQRRTGAGTIHNMTEGRAYSMRGESLVNDSSKSWGKADCGALVSTAARATDAAVTCSKCVGVQA